MVIEFLTFRIPLDERPDWMQADDTTWSRFLERQDGFVRKQIWVDVDDPDHIHAMIEWESLDHWKSIPHDELAAVDVLMGTRMREPTCRTFEVIRDS